MLITILVLTSLVFVSVIAVVVSSSLNQQSKLIDKQAILIEELTSLSNNL